jgi:hypothetical protein
MVKQCLVLLGFLLFAFIPLQTADAKTVSNVEGQHVTTEDIVRDIIFPIIDKRLIKEYGSDASSWYGKIVGITYNDNHSYDVEVRTQIRSNNKKDLVKVRIFPFCHIEKFNELKCNRGLNIEIEEYKHLSP